MRAGNSASLPREPLQQIVPADPSISLQAHRAVATSPRSPYAATFLGGGLNVGTSAPSSKPALTPHPSLPRDKPRYDHSFHLPK
ncbi:hypothetical protein JOQ06_011943, partial [Pogonophryne albipinna]